jgi:two-component sensor histidine kinase
VELHPATYGGISPEHWCLKIWDNGVGLPADFDARQAQSLGLQLVTDLATQLGGRLETERDAGACFSVTFPIIAT